MAIDLFGYTFGKKNPKIGAESLSKRPVSFVPPDSEDGASFVDASAGFFSSIVDFDGQIKNDRQLVYKYREMSLHSEVDAAIDDIVNEAIVIDDLKNIVELNLDHTTLSKATKDKVQKEFEDILNLLNFHNKGYDIFRKWYIDGKIFYHAIVSPDSPQKGIVELRPVDAAKMQKIREVEKKTISGTETGGAPVEVIENVSEWYLYNDDDAPNLSPNWLGTSSLSSNGLKIHPNAIVYCHSGLFDLQKRKTYGYLHKAIKPLNQLRMIEDAVVIYRISRAPERRIFYIDVGSLPKNKAEQYLRDIMNRYRNKMTYDAATGEVRDDRRFQSMLEDFWLPRREGGRGTEISTLPGGENLGRMEDVEYFKEKLYRSLNVPISRLQSDNGFNMGRSSEITRDELKFFKFIEKLRLKFSDLFIQTLKIQLVSKNIMSEEEFEQIKNNFQFDYARDSYFTELKNTEILTNRMNLLRDIKEHVGTYYSHEFVRKKILKQSEEDIKDIDNQLQKEREEGRITDDTKEFY